MKYTTKLNLNKPDLTDYVSIEDLNHNMDILDEAVGKVTEGTTLIPDLQTVDKTLAGAINEVDKKVNNTNTIVKENETNIKTLDNNLTMHLAEDASTSKKGHVQLSDSTSSTSTILAATANAVKKVWDLAVSKYSKPLDGIPKIDLNAAVQTSLNKADTSIQESMRNQPNGFVGLDENGNPPFGIKAFYEAFSLIGVTVQPNSYWERRIPIPPGKNHSFKFMYNRYSGYELFTLIGSRIGLANNYVENQKIFRESSAFSFVTNALNNISYDFYNAGTMRMTSAYFDKSTNEFVIRVTNPHATATQSVQTYGDYKLEVYYE